MWVRSQNRRTLTNGEVSYFIKKILLIGDETKYLICLRKGIVSDTPLDNNLVLAEYYLQEKAMKVMDMLEEHIRNKETVFDFPLEIRKREDLNDDKF